MKPGLSSLKFVRLVQPSIRVSTKAISPFTRGLIQLIRQHSFLVTSSKPKTQTELLSCQSIQTSNFHTGYLNVNFPNIKNLRWRADEKKSQAAAHTFFSFQGCWSRSIAQHLTNSFLATAVIAIFLRDGLPRKSRL